MDKREQETNKLFTPCMNDLVETRSRVNEDTTISFC
jgi:hypothetical protein